MSSPMRHVDVPDRLRWVKRKMPASSKRVLRRTMRRYGTRTSQSRGLPDFLVVGTKRGGTTSLWNYLVKHPHVLPMFPATQQMKSPHYFDLHFERGPSWYRSHFPTYAVRERHAERTGVRPVCGEASPYYMFHPLAAERAVRTVPSAKVIMLLRNPVDRAYSHYNERVGGGHEPLVTFEEALAAEPERMAGEEQRIVTDPGYYSHDHDCYSYVARGRYVEQLGRWAERFPAEQMLVLLSEDLYRDPGGVFSRVCAFLGLPPAGLSGFPRHNYLPTSSMEPATRRHLSEYFHPHNDALTQQFGLRPDWDG